MALTTFSLKEDIFGCDGVCCVFGSRSNQQLWRRREGERNTVTSEKSPSSGGMVIQLATCCCCPVYVLWGLSKVKNASFRVGRRLWALFVKEARDCF